MIMATDVILYILAVMILYDFHLHVIESIHGSWEKAWEKKYYWPPLKIFGQRENRKFYKSSGHSTGELRSS